jgi:glycosyltransferase involved in cell wall biosynthesis
MILKLDVSIYTIMINTSSYHSKSATIILPCQNEEEALPICLKQIQKVAHEHNLELQIIVSDSSYDNSPKIAKDFGVELIKHDLNGYGNAYLKAIPFAKHKYIIMADSDATYDFSYIPKFIAELDKGADVVLGNRFSHNMELDAMPFLNKHFGNPILSGMLRLFFHVNIKDSQTGFRAIRKSVISSLGLVTTGMEFASELIIKAIRSKLRIVEIPISYRKRIGKSKLRPFSDAWKHIRFMLLYSPTYLFFIPGLVLFLGGLLSLIIFLLTTVQIFGITLYVHPMFISSLATIVGYQLIFFGFFAKTYLFTQLHEKTHTMQRVFRLFTIEKIAIPALFCVMFGFVFFFGLFLYWFLAGFPEIRAIKLSIFALTLIVLGIQTFFSAFVLSILGIEHER